MKHVAVACLLSRFCISLTSCQQPSEPIDVLVPQGFSTVTATQTKFAGKVETLTRGMTRQEVLQTLGSPADQTSDLFFYELVEGHEGGYYVTATLSFDEHGLTGAELGFGHVSLEPRVDP